MNNKKINILYICATLLIVQTIILLNLQYLANSSTGGSFIPYSFRVVLYVLIALIIILSSILILKNIIKKDLKIKRTIISVIIVTVLTYCINLLLFGCVIDPNDFDNDGLSNDYENLIGSNIFIKNTESQTFKLQNVHFKNNLFVENISIYIDGTEDYLDVSANDITKDYLGDMAEFLQIEIDNFGASEPTLAKSFNKIKVEIFLKQNYSLEDYSPATYVKANQTMENLKMPQNKIEYLNHTLDYDKNCYVIEIPYSFYLREDLYRADDGIYIGLVPNYK